MEEEKTSPVLVIDSIPVNWDEARLEDGELTFAVYAEALYHALGTQGTLEFFRWIKINMQLTED